MSADVVEKEREALLSKLAQVDEKVGQRGVASSDRSWRLCRGSPLAESSMPALKASKKMCTSTE